MAKRKRFVWDAREPDGALITRAFTVTKRGRVNLPYFPLTHEQMDDLCRAWQTWRKERQAEEQNDR